MLPSALGVPANGEEYYCLAPNFDGETGRRACQRQYLINRPVASPFTVMGCGTSIAGTGETRLARRVA